MRGLLIVDNDAAMRRQLLELFTEHGYDVIVSNSAATALYGVLKKLAPVVLLGSEFDSMTAAEFIPLLKKCNPDIAIILISDEIPLPLLCKVRREGIFYHALKPSKEEDRDEIKRVVECAFEKVCSYLTLNLEPPGRFIYSGR